MDHSKHSKALFFVAHFIRGQNDSLAGNNYKNTKSLFRKGFCDARVSNIYKQSHKDITGNETEQKKNKHYKNITTPLNVNRMESILFIRICIQILYAMDPSFTKSQSFAENVDKSMIIIIRKSYSVVQS